TSSLLLLLAEARKHKGRFRGRSRVLSPEHSRPLANRFDQKQRDQGDENAGHKRIQTIVEDEPGITAGCCKLSRLSEKSNARVSIENFVPGCGECYNNEPGERHQRDQRIARAMG